MRLIVAALLFAGCPRETGSETEEDVVLDLGVVTVVPDRGRVGDVLTCSASNVIPGPEIVVSYAWINETTDRTLPPGKQLTVEGQHTSPGDVLMCVMTARHTSGAVAEGTASAVVENTPPAAPKVWMAPGATVDDTLWCTVSAPASDPDLDEVTYAISWTVDDAPFTGATTTEAPNDTVLPTHTRDGQRWTCHVTPHDGREQGAVGTAEVTIGGSCPPPPELSSALAAEFTFPIPASSINTWAQVAGAGDVDGDGHADLIVRRSLVFGGPSLRSAPLEEVGHPYHWDGEPGEVDTLYRAAGVGDVDGDGYGDVLVGSFTSGVGSTVFLLKGGPDPSFGLSSAAVRFGALGVPDATGVGDVDGDGFDDMLVTVFRGADTSPTFRLYLVMGSPSLASRYLPDDPARFDDPYTPRLPGGEGGWVSHAGAGGVNGDGYDDFLYGAYLAGPEFGEHHGLAALFLGEASVGARPLDPAAVFQSSRQNDYAAVTVAGVEDVNGDGYADVAVASVYGAYLLLGRAVPASRSLDGADARYLQEDAGIAFAVTGAGDVNGDGLSDLAVAGGDTYIVLGETTPTSRPLQYSDARIGGRSANGIYAVGAVAGVGDVDGDGYSDLLVGEAASSGGPATLGRAVLLLGCGW